MCSHLTFNFPAIDALVFDYSVKFPLSLVISRKTILRYQLLFRFLLNLKHAEQSLSSVWIDHKTTTWRQTMQDQPEFEKWKPRVFLLRARMLSFVQQILAFATFEVLEPNWRALEGKLDKVSTVDQLLRDHVDFLDTCLKECMLTSSKLIKVSVVPCPCVTFSYHRTTGLLETDCDMFNVCDVRAVVHTVREQSRGWYGNGARPGSAMGYVYQVRSQLQSLVSLWFFYFILLV